MYNFAAKSASIVFFLCTLFISAQSHSGDYSENAELVGLIEELVTQHNFDRDELKELFSTAKRKESIIEAISRPAESTITWKGYRNIFLSGDRPKQGVKFWQTHKETLERASKTYGIPIEIIVSIIGVETRYGKHKGKYRVIDALSTLAFDYPKRAKFFRKELLEFIILCREANIEPSTAVGSYAGAMGYGQFIPSSYRRYAVDFDNDGIIDIINNPVDAIGSVANYFKAHHWVNGQAIAGRARITNQAYDAIVNKSLKPKLTIKQIKKEGLSPIDCKESELRYCLTINSSDKATAMKLQGEKGAEFWIGAKNFYVITRYNHSKLYAMAVFQLSEEIKSLAL